MHTRAIRYYAKELWVFALDPLTRINKKAQCSVRRQHMFSFIIYSLAKVICQLANDRLGIEDEEK